MNLTRREFVAGAMAALPLAAAGDVIVDTRVELISAEPQQFPLAPGLAAKPASQPVERYLQFAAAAGMTRAIVVQPDVYRDDHRYMEYCFTKEPTRGFFRAECMFDAKVRDSADKLTTEIGLNPRRFVALRQNGRGLDYTAPQTKALWRRAAQLKVAVDLDLQAGQSEAALRLAEQSGVNLIVGAAADDPAALVKFAKLPKALLRWIPGTVPLAAAAGKKLYEAFGPERIIAGGLGHDKAALDRSLAQLSETFGFAGEAGIRAIRGESALKAFGWS